MPGMKELFSRWFSRRPSDQEVVRRQVRERQRMAAQLPGGSATQPIVVASPVVIPIRARATRCPLCDGELRLEEETALTVEAVRLRATHMICARCRVKRTLWFRISAPPSN